MKLMPIQQTMCATCPFKEGSPHANLRNDLADSALSNASRICHSTGKNALYTTKVPEKLCRGARDLQLQIFHRIGFLKEPTDAAWDAKCSEMGIKPVCVRSNNGNRRMDKGRGPTAT